MSVYGFPPALPEFYQPSRGGLAAGSEPATHRLRIPCAAPNDDQDYSANWAGHVVPNTFISGTPNIIWSESQWKQPGVPANSNYPDSDYNSAPDDSFWTGTGSYNLIQAGADSIATATSQYKFWTEDQPQPTVWEGPGISPGDVAYAYTDWLGNDQANYFLANQTTGHYSAFTNPAPDDGWRAANFIQERIEPYYLPDFGTVPVSNDFFGNNSDTWTLSTNDIRYVMTSNCLSTGKDLSYPTSVVGPDGDFSQVWEASGPTDNSNSC